MSKCLIGREVVIAIRHKKRGDPSQYSVVCPHKWSKTQFLRYVREEHPHDSVRIVEWKDTGGWSPTLWIANPMGFSDYARGFREVAE